MSRHPTSGVRQPRQATTRPRLSIPALPLCGFLRGLGALCVRLSPPPRPVPLALDDLQLITLTVAKLQKKISAPTATPAHGRLRASGRFYASTPPSRPFRPGTSAFELEHAEHGADNRKVPRPRRAPTLVLAKPHLRRALPATYTSSEFNNLKTTSDLACFPSIPRFPHVLLHRQSQVVIDKNY
jgi:hypothetical protein